MSLALKVSAVQKNERLIMERPCWLKSVDGRHVRKNKHCELIKANKMLHIMCHVTVAAQIENSNYKTAQCTHTYNGHNII